MTSFSQFKSNPTWFNHLKRSHHSNLIIRSSHPLIRSKSTITSTSSNINSTPTLHSNSNRSISTTHPNGSIELRTNPAPAFQHNPTIPISELPSRHHRPSDEVDGELLDSSFIGMSGGMIFHEMMLRHDVKHVFGYPGGAILPVFDAIYNSKHFNFILPRHEQGAGHMAEGYARVSGKPGIVLVTSGPGATNTITPMQDAYSDGTPMIVFTGQVATSAIGSDAFQEADVIGISRSCTKWNVMVKDITDLPRRINEAFKIATSGRPGPVLVDLPKDMTAGILRTPIPLKYTQPDLVERALPSNPLRTRSRSFQPVASGSRSQSQGNVTADPSLLQQASKMILNAKRPLIYAGQGILSSPDGPKLLKRLSDEWNIPVTTTLMGMGAFDEEDPKSLHMLGMHGSAYANLAMQDADVIIALGARFDDRVTGKVDTFAPHARAAAAQGRGGIIHFEVQPKNINKVVNATCPIEGDVVENLEQLLEMMPKRSDGPPSRTEWLDTIRTWKAKYPFIYEPSLPGEPMKPQEIIEALDQWAKSKAGRKENLIISTGVGQHQIWTSPRSIVTSGGLGTMGYGLPAAIGAKVAEPNKIVVDIDGDASLSMTAMELATAHEFNIGVKVIVLDNEFQGMVLQWQDLFYESRYSSTRMTNPDFCALAKAMHCHAIYLTDREHCFPMVPAGKALHQQILHPLLRK
ncbi:hypothetical protein DFH28DRAFT_1080589 [Melampsora americana]|nr:hypothetical protein DFH28DRAFT_1080589 [Melampsora americana]